MRKKISLFFMVLTLLVSIPAFAGDLADKVPLSFKIASEVSPYANACCILNSSIGYAKTSEIYLHYGEGAQRCRVIREITYYCPTCNSRFGKTEYDLGVYICDGGHNSISRTNKLLNND